MTMTTDGYATCPGGMALDDASVEQGKAGEDFRLATFLHAYSRQKPSQLAAMKVDCGVGVYHKEVAPTSLGKDDVLRKENGPSP